MSRSTGTAATSCCRRAASRIVEHEPGDLTAIVEAGLRVSELNAALERHGQMLALDPPGDPDGRRLRRGGLSGPRSHRYGTPRDLVIGVTVVLADGTVASSGGKVVKNVAGYDLGKLFCGSRGRLGLVARVALRLHPLPETARTLVRRSTTGRRVAPARALLHAPLAPSALDVLWPGRLAALFEGSARGVESQLASARALVGGDENGDVWDEAAERQLAARGRLPSRRRSSRPARAAAADARPPGGALAYVAGGGPSAPSPLPERVRAAFDPEGMLVA